MKGKLGYLTVPDDLVQKYGLDEKRIKVAMYLAIPRCYRPKGGLTKLAEELGVSGKTAHTYSTELKVQELSVELMRRNFITELPDVVENMRKMATTGEGNVAVSAARLYIEFCENLMKMEGKVTVNLTQNNFYTDEEVKEKIEKLLVNTEPEPPSVTIDADVIEPKTED